MRSWMWCVVAAAAAFWVGSCARIAPPRIIAVTATPQSVGVGDSSSLAVSIDYAAPSKLKIRWQTKDGKVASPGDSVTGWKAPAKPGTARISVTVTDRAKQSVAETVQVMVSQSSPMYSGSLGTGEPTGRHPRSPTSRIHQGRKTSNAAGGDQTAPSPRRNRATKTK